ncbi:MAG: DUF202 domain-containing protein [Corynebacterium sp.]|uniref:DUF202 domain-containing protein n=1 Tax=Corynebacterium sp. TaxID=1720 RepID=UPI003F9A8D66
MTATAAPAAAPSAAPDPGLQPERTTMAWGRTSLAYLVAAAVMLRWAPHYGGIVVLASGVLLLVAFGIYGTQRRRYRRSARSVHGAGELLGASVVPVIALAVCTVLLGCAGIAFVAVDALGGAP